MTKVPLDGVFVSNVFVKFLKFELANRYLFHMNVKNVLKCEIKVLNSD